MAAASVPPAQGVSPRCERRGPRPQARAGALLRRLGSHPSDSSAGKTPAGPVLPHHRGER